jgi:hypothetical protein
MNWPVTCPLCGKEFDSMDSHADSRIMLRAHIEREHGSEHETAQH